MLLVIAKHGNAVIVGRAAGQVLPRDKGLCVRITAPLPFRCQRYAQTNNITLAEATAIVKKTDKDKARFVKNFASKDLADARDYDLVCNTEKLSPASVAKLIWRAFDERIVSMQENPDSE